MDGHMIRATTSTAAHESEHETTPLLQKSKNSHLWTARLQNHLVVDFSESWADLALLACYVITGLLDSSSVFIWGSFVSMQTGNTIYLGLGLIAPTEDDRWLRSGTSILCFCLGSWFFSTYHRMLSPRKRWVIVSSYLLQLVMMTAAALMVTLGPKTSKEARFSLWVGVPIALIAFQSAGQAVTSRVLQYNGLTSVVLTSNYCDLFSDPKLFTSGLWENAERNRRIAAPVLLLLGAMLGGLWSRSDIGLIGALWSAVVLKLGVTAAWFFWAADCAVEE
nr:hypothetical protein B0A51_10299 [Rachicladosporium sp. CCFEE 5018]